MTKRLDARIGQLERHQEPMGRAELLRWFEGVTEEELEAVMVAERDTAETPAYDPNIQLLSTSELIRLLKPGIEAVRCSRKNI